MNQEDNCLIQVYVLSSLALLCFLFPFFYAVFRYQCLKHINRVYLLPLTDVPI